MLSIVTADYLSTARFHPSHQSHIVISLTPHLALILGLLLIRSHAWYYLSLSLKSSKSYGAAVLVIIITPATIAQFVHDKAVQLAALKFGWILLGGLIGKLTHKAVS